MLTRARRRVRAVRARCDAGVSLAELITAITLATILGAVTVQLFVSVNDSTAASTDRSVNTAGARNTMQSWSAYLHVADGAVTGSASSRFEWLTADNMMFYASLANRSGGLNATGAPTMMWLRRDSTGRLIEEQFPSGAAAGATWAVCRVLTLSTQLTTFTNSSTSGLFTASDTNGNPLTATSTHAGVDLGSAPAASAGCQALPVTVPSQSGTPDPVAVANLTIVASVGIAFRMSDTKALHTLEFTSVATMPTLGGT